MEEIFKKTKIFKGLAPEELKEIKNIIKKKNFEEGSVLFKEGQSGRRLYIIELGRVDIYLNIDMNGAVRI